MKIGLVGVGAIAIKQHQPAIAASDAFTLVATASRNNTIDGIANHKSLSDMLAAVPDIEAVTLCVPPAVRYAFACEAIDAGRHVFLEKPPGLAVSEVMALADRAAARGVTLFASWHSRFGPAVEPLRRHLAAHPPHSVTVTWKEDVRFYHPGQRWIWEAGGFGVFDPGINAFSILTHALPDPLRVVSADLFVPQNCAQPIRAELMLRDSRDAAVACVFDFDQPDNPTWEIRAETDAGPVRLAKGGAAYFEGEREILSQKKEEYPALYARFAELCRERKSEVDVAPLTLVADCFLCANTTTVAPFYEDVPAKR